MSATNTPPAAPTAAGYAAALALIDSTVMESSVDVAGFPIMLADTRVLTAVIAVARAAVAETAGLARVMAERDAAVDYQWWDDAMTLAAGCRRHPGYRVHRRPTADCETCCDMWDRRHGLDGWRAAVEDIALRATTPPDTDRERDSRTEADQ